MTAQNLTTNHQLENSMVETYPLLKAQAKELRKNSHTINLFQQQNNQKIYTEVKYSPQNYQNI
ncbi:MAG: hypothetical protein SWX82_16280 [Cyanobacteriota bacterium]|nr:hypothetical protein [Cyanobacteriota bacterium]